MSQFHVTLALGPVSSMTEVCNDCTTSTVERRTPVTRRRDVGRRQSPEADSAGGTGAWPSLASAPGSRSRSMPGRAECRMQSAESRKQRVGDEGERERDRKRERETAVAFCLDDLEVHPLSSDDFPKVCPEHLRENRRRHCLSDTLLWRSGRTGSTLCSSVNLGSFSFFPRPFFFSTSTRHLQLVDRLCRLSLWLRASDGSSQDTSLVFMFQK